jgi:hypothetical protein
MKWRSCLWVGLVLVGVGVLGTAATDDETLYLGGVRLDLLQNTNGGWDWPLNDGNPGTGSALNTIGPIAMGLARAEWNGSDPAFRAALADTGGLLLTKTSNFSPSDGYLATALDSVFGGTTYRDFLTAKFYGPLAAGTYNRNGAGTLYSTASYVQLIRTNRAGSGNIAEWDIGMGAVAAVACGADPAAWVSGIKAELNEHNSNAYYDVIGLAGAVYGLAVAGADFDPTTGALAAASNLHDLADILAGYQIRAGTGAGGFAWNANYVIPNDNDEAVQETAYAILALSAVDRSEYLSVIEDAAEWLIAFQLGTGGWGNYAGSGENNEVTAEAMWGVHGVYLADVWVGAGGSDSGFGFGFLPFASVQKGVETIEGFGGTVHVAAGTYPGSVTFSAGAMTLVSDSGAAATTIGGSLLLNSASVIIGRMGEGFTINGPITVGVGVDASTIHINWNDIYDVVSNGGGGWLDATYNFWGEDGPDTVGLVSVYPYLPVTTDTLIGYVDEYGYSVSDAIAFATLLVDGATISEAELILLLGSEFGLSTEEAAALIGDYGRAAVHRAASRASSLEELMLNLVGYVASIPSGGAGGGAGGDLGSYVVGSVVPLFLVLADPFTGDPVVDAMVTYSVARTLDGMCAIERFGVMPYDAAAGGYAFALDTTGLTPGSHVVYLGTDDGRSVSYTIVLTE